MWDPSCPEYNFYGMKLSNHNLLQWIGMNSSESCEVTVQQYKCHWVNSLRRRWSSLGFVCAGHLVLSKERASMLRCFQLWNDEFDGLQIFKTSRDLKMWHFACHGKLWTLLSTLLSQRQPANLGTVVVLWLREKCHTNSSLLDTFSDAEKLRPDWCFRVIYARIWRNGLHPLGSSLRHSGQHWSSGGEVSTATQSLEVIVSVIATLPQHLTAIRLLDSYNSYRIHIWVLLSSLCHLCHLCLSDFVVEGSVVVLLFGPGLQGRRGALGWASPHGKVLTPEVLVAWTCKVLLGDTEAVRTVIVACFGCALCVAWLQLMCFLQWFVCDFTGSRVSARLIPVAFWSLHQHWWKAWRDEPTYRGCRDAFAIFCNIWHQKFAENHRGQWLCLLQVHVAIQFTKSDSLTFDFACRGSAACLTDPAVYQGNDSYLLLWRGKPVADPCCSCQWILIVDAINPQLIRTSRRFRHFGRWWIFATFARCARLAMGGRRNPIDSDSSNLWIPLPLRLADCGCMVTHKVCIARAALFARHMVGWRTSKCLPIIAKERLV